MHLDPFTLYDVLTEDEIGLILRQEEIDLIRLAVKEIVVRGAAWLQPEDRDKFRGILLDLTDIENKVFDLKKAD